MEAHACRKHNAVEGIVLGMGTLSKLPLCVADAATSGRASKNKCDMEALAAVAASARPLQLTEGAGGLTLPVFCTDLAADLPRQPFFAANVHSSSGSFSGGPKSMELLSTALCNAEELPQLVSKLGRIVQSLPKAFKGAGIVEAVQAATSDPGISTLRANLACRTQASTRVFVSHAVYAEPTH